MLIAGSAVILFVLYVLHKPLFSGQAIRFWSGGPISEFIRWDDENFTRYLAHYTVVAQFLRHGIFPAWFPAAQGGTPFIGSILPAVFSPFNLPFYIGAAHWLPHLIPVAVVLKFVFCFFFMYLLARVMGIGVFGSVFAGFSLITTPHFYDWIFHGVGSAAVFGPALFLVVELYFRLGSLLILSLIPWAMALPFLCGHFETAFLANAAAGVYFCARLWKEKALSPEHKQQMFFRFAGAALMGGLLCGFLILAGNEYVAYSYTNIWRTLPAFGYIYYSVSKHLLPEDWPGLAAGWLCIGGVVFALMKQQGLSADHPLGRRLAWLAGGAMLLALGSAILAQFGFDLSLYQLFQHCNWTSVPMSGLTWIVTLFLLFLAAWTWSNDPPPALRIVSGLLLIVMIIRLKTPPFTYLMVQLPVFGVLNNVDYQYVYDIGIGLLCGSALSKLRQLAQSSYLERRKTAFRALCISAVFIAGYLGAFPIRNYLSSVISTGTWNAAEHGGGFYGPERIATNESSYALSGWTSRRGAVSSVEVGIVGGHTPPVKARLSGGGGGREDFETALPLESEGDDDVYAKITFADNQQQILPGPRIAVHHALAGAWPWIMLVMLAFPCLFLLSENSICAVYFLVIAFWVYLLNPYKKVPADQAPPPLSELSAIQKDTDLFRISSFSYPFFHADAAAMYGLSDFRTGGDNLDVYAMIEFQKLANALSNGNGSPQAREMGLRLLGLANVRYLLDVPDARPGNAGLQKVIAGENMSIFKNLYVRPRALFFENFVYLPLKPGDLSDPNTERRVLGSIMGGLMNRQLDPERTLLLHDAPAAVPAAPAASAGQDPVVIEVADYSPNRVELVVKTARPGFVFLSDNYFPGWEATVDGKEVKILRSWITFRAVQVGAGRSVVEFKYRPATLRWGLAACLLAIVSWLVFYGVGRNRPPPYFAAVPLLAKSQKKSPGGTKKQKTAVPDAVDPEADGTLRMCASAAHALILSLVIALLAYWAFWAGFVYEDAATRTFRHALIFLLGPSFGVLFWINRKRPAN